LKIVDVNVLLDVANEASNNHGPAVSFWESAQNGHEPIGLAWITVVGYLRIVTSPSIFPSPLRLEAALGRVSTWLSSGVVRVVREKDDHWDLFRSLVAQTGARGNLATDAHLAALAISHDAVLVSFDRDFSRFKGLRWERPGD